MTELRIDGEADGLLVEMNGRTVLDATPRAGQQAEVVMTLVGPVP